MAENPPLRSDHSLPDPDATQDMEPPELVRLLDQYMAELNRGVAPDRAKLLADHPDLASQLEQCLAGIEFIHRAGTPAITQLGDFRILRELGRGGMGVVYEAEQISLRRLVALKVLRFGAVADKEAIERFQREGETIALLHHTNIVPIFAIGSEHGVAFYAMQLIEGENLADVMARQRANPTAAPALPAAYAEIARWGLEAAEALAHAHQRGVIHRDVKPSNLILDKQGRVWLTDFGLARRMDEVTLTTVGLAGTPRYMSPEQAAAVRRPIDHRTDIYSLGATLYELATGSPLFASDTPHGVLSQILTVEPTRPRIVRSSIPRDLETIILKCLAKEPAQRYATAQALVDDMRAFREGRAVKARRARLPERAVRWVKARKKSAMVAGVAAVATLVIAAVLFFALRRYSAAQMVHISMVNDGAPLKVEVFDEAERNVVATFTAPTQEAQELPPGKYHVRLSADARLSETSLFDADPGGNYHLTAALSPRDPWEFPIGGDEVVETIETVHIDDRDDPFLASPNTIRRLRGDTGEGIWEINLSARDQPLLANVLNSPEDSFSLQFTSLVRPLADLDGDGSPDLIYWASRSGALLVAVSGKTGRVLWCHRGQTVPARDPHASAYQTPFFQEKIVGRPLMAEVDGKKVVVAMYSAVAPHPHPQTWLEGISAVTGEPIWRRLVEPNHALDAGDPAIANTWASACGKLHGRTIGAIVYGNRLIGFNLLTGDPAWPDRVLDAIPPVGVRFSDMLGDGDIAVLFVRLGVTRQTFNNGPWVKETDLSVVVVNPLVAAPLWEKPLPKVALPAQGLRADSLFDWPLVVDLTGKGNPQVVVPWVDSKTNSCGLEVLDGRTGVTRWKHRLSGVNHERWQAQPDRMVAGPDLAGDGFRELFVATCDEVNHRAYVDALAGSDGRSRWTCNQPFDGGYGGKGYSPFHWWQSLRWWQAGRDGRAMLVVSAPAGSLLLLASTGHVEHVLNGFGDPQIADLNGDGIPDLFAYGPDSTSPTPGTRAKGKLRVIRGTPPTAWQMLSSDTLMPTQDLNGDGIADLVFSQAKKAFSGKDGSLLWESDGIASPAYGGQVADVKRDGTPVLFSVALSDDKKRVTLRAASGRDGKLLWNAEFKTGADELNTGANESQTSVAGTVLGCPVFEGGKSPDVLFLNTHPGPRHMNGGRTSWYWLTRIASHDGQIRWRQPLSDPDALCGEPGPIAIADLNGDGVNDIVFWVPLDRGDTAPAVSQPAASDGGPNGVARYELRAYSGRDGKLLWRRPGFYDDRGMPSSFRSWPQMPRPLIINDNGRPLVLITDILLAKDSEQSYAQVVALDGRDGRAVWSWRGDDGSVMDQSENWSNGSPQAARTSAGPAIVVSVFNQHDPAPFHHIVQLDTRGHVLTRTDVLKDDNIVPAPSYITASHFDPGHRPCVWVYDLNGDGLDELIWVDQDVSKCEVRAMRAGSGTSFWEFKSSYGRLFWDYAQIRAILPAGKNCPATVAVNVDGRVVGLAGPTGKTRWQYESPQPANVELLESSGPLGLPRVFERSAGGQSTSRLALPVDDAGVYLPAAAIEVEHPEPAADPRLLIPLPWTSDQFEVWPESISVLLAWIGVMAAVIWAHRPPRRWRRIAGLFACLVGLWFEMAGAVGFRYVPYVAMAIATVIWARRQPCRGRSIAAVIVCWFGLTALGAAVWLWCASRTMLPDERFDRNGWNRGAFPMLLVGVAATAGLVAALSLFRLIRRASKRRTNAAPAGMVASA